MHGADLVRAERLTEEVDGGHLAAEDALLVHVRGRTDVALVEGLEKKKRKENQTKKNLFYTEQ